MPPGMTSAPVCMADRFRMSCRYSGSRIIEPMKAMNATDISSSVIVKVRDLSARRSISGLPDFCRRSW